MFRLKLKIKAEFSAKFVVLAISVILIVGIFAGYYIPLDSSTQQLNTLDERIIELSEKISRIENALSELKNQGSELAESLSELESSISEVESQYGEATSQIEQVKKVLQEEIESVSESISELQSRNESKTVDMLFEEVSNSVVSIKVGVVRSGFTGQAQGSGFVFSDEGYIVTNNHVVEDFEAELGIEVVFMDGTLVPGELVASDPESDLAVSRITLPEGIEPLPLGDSSKIRVGEPVIAIGNPFGLGGSITTGIVSQTRRTLTTDTGYLIPSVIQFDAAINPGNSGGPLLNYEGEVIGVTTAGILKAVGEGIGFAIPSNTVKKVIRSLIEKGEYIHPWTGIQGMKLTLQIAESMKLNTTKGILITDVVKYSPAEIAGLREGNQTIMIYGQPVTIGGDVIVQVDEVEVRNFEDLVAYINENKNPRDTINLTVLRHGVKLLIPLTLGERPLANQYPGYANVKINVFNNQTAIVNFAYRPLGGESTWESIKDRPHWPILIGVAMSMTGNMLNVTRGDLLSKEITENDFWQDEDWRGGGAWLIKVTVNLTESPNWERNGETFKLTIHDPWKPFGFLDAVNITSTDFSIIDYNYTPTSATDITEGSIQENYLLWLSTQFKESPETYVVKFG